MGNAGRLVRRDDMITKMGSRLINTFSRAQLRIYYNNFSYLLGSYGLFPDEDQAKLLRLKNSCAGKRVFVIGNGPSLNETPLERLSGEVTIGCNGLFLNFEKMGYLPSYYTVEDRLVAEDRAATINSLRGTIKILPRDLRYCLSRDEDVIYVNFLRNYKGFPKLTRNFVRQVYWGGTVTMMNIQLAYFLGSREVYLVGVDHSYRKPFENDQVQGTVIRSENPDVNHFHPDYFGPGFRYHDPKVDRMELAYREARRFFEAHGGAIYNATVGGQLEVFPRVNLDDVIGKG